ncbi:MAG: NADP-dependent isocitrate dehydrogenase [Deltaproteobacteria bacterium]|nr:NADP-dependent isocitrate dehydrogenase [Deltaproteobacteria bacterium]
MSKIKVKNTIVEMNGDEMTRIIWNLIKKTLILSYLDVKLETYDLGLDHRNETGDQVTIDAAQAIKKHKVGVKCSTITPDEGRVKEYQLTKQWKSPNGTIRNYLKGTIFRKPIIVKNIRPHVCGWKKPIIVGRHAFGDLYRSQELRIPEPGVTTLCYTPNSRPDWSQSVKLFEFSQPGIIMGLHNTDKSIQDFAATCMNYALSEKMDLWFSVKDTISKTYHRHFKQIFAEVFEGYHARFEEAGINYRYLLIDDAVAQVIKSKGGFIWALRNYDGDVMSDMVAAGFGSLGMMTSVLVSPTGAFEYEAAHGTVKRHFYEYKKGNPTSTNSVASIFAWTGAIRKRGELDETPDVVHFADVLEETVIDLIEQGVVTKDLTHLIQPSITKYETTESFLEKIATNLDRRLNG